MSVRDQIRMTGEEIWAFLAETPHIQIATLDRTGAPHLVTMRYAPVGRRIVFHTYGKSQKAKNLARDPRIAVLAETGLEYPELRGVSINGRARLVDDPAEALDLAFAVRRRYDTESSDEALRAATGEMLAKRIVVEVHPERFVTWDHTKLAALGRSY